MIKKKRLTKIDRLRRQRSKAVLLLMDRHDLNPERVAAETDTQTLSVYKALEGRISAPRIISFLEENIGSEFSDLWFKYPDHSAA